MRHIILAATLLFFACGGNTTKSVQSTAEVKQTDTIEVLYFHSKKRCITCNAIETLTKEVVDSLANGKIIMKIVDISKDKNEAIANKYEVTWSSLIISGNGKIDNLTKMGFGYAKNKPAEFKAKLLESLNKIRE